jgi:hypothetical protein
MTLSRMLRAGVRLLRRTSAAAATRSAVVSLEPFDAASWLEGRSGRLPSYGAAWVNAHELLPDRWPARVADVLAAADNAVAHRFVLLGCGPYEPIDPERPAVGEYRPVDWQLDPSSGERFPHGFRHTEWNPSMRPGRADIKLPWELARSHHWVNLGQAWRLTGEPRYAREIASQLADFEERNPVGVGIHWTCTMDVAIRAVNWVLAYELVEPCDAIDAPVRQRWAEALWAHGHFIRSHLENTYEVTSNHFLSNIVSLWFLGTFFRGTPAGDRWRAFAAESLETEMTTQVHEEGADFESSVPYHRLVTELFLAAARVGQAHGHTFSDAFLARLRRMVGFLQAVLRPDGLMPQVGDADDGRLHVFAGVGRWHPQDARHLFGPAAVVFDEPRLLESGGETATFEAYWWGGGVLDATAAPFGDNDAHFRQTGIAVSRRGDTYLLVTNGRVGTRGFGNHKHNELLSFEYHALGVPWVVDPGSYVYTGDPESRNLFRSTRYHSTLQVDNVEQNEVNPEWLFRMFEKANPVCIEWTASSERCDYVGRHEGFCREGGPVHERRFALEHATGRLEITDVTIGGSGTRRLRWHFHCAPGVSATGSSGLITLTAAGRTCLLRYSVDLEATIGRGWYSPSYGVRQPCAVIDLALPVTLPSDRAWSLVLEPVA